MEHIQSAIRAYFDARQEELIQAVCRLVRIDSTLGPAAPGQPFGPGPAAALDELVALATEWGLTAQNLEGYVGAVDLNDRETELHILGHLDVVDPGEGWTVTSAFEPKLVDGLLYGRGTDDDKGPVLAALMAMRAVKDLGFSLKKNVRLIAGTDEETGFRDIHWYYDRHPYAPHTLSPDADFPIINIEKGHYQPTFRAAWPQEAALPRVSSFTGGPRLNMVPPKAQATVLGLTAEQVNAAIAALGMEAAISYTVAPAEGGVRIQASGQNAHGSTPEEGHNAQTALLTLLAALPLADCPSTQAIQDLVRLFPHGDHIGQALGVAQSDDLSGLHHADPDRHRLRGPLRQPHAPVRHGCHRPPARRGRLAGRRFHRGGRDRPAPPRPGHRPLFADPGLCLRAVQRPGEPLHRHRRRDLCPRHPRRRGLRGQYARLRLQPPRPR